MALIIHLHSEDEDLVARLEGRAEETRTPLRALPSIERLQADPYQHGQALIAALGGEADLLARWGSLAQCGRENLRTGDLLSAAVFPATLLALASGDQLVSAASNLLPCSFQPLRLTLRLGSFLGTGQLELKVVLCVLAGSFNFLW